MTKKQWKLIDILNLSSQYLSEQQIENARLNAEMLIGDVLKLKRVELYLNYEKPLQRNEVDLIRSLIKRRAQHEPLQYILGETEFYSLKFKVNRHTLIPRPETEILVDKIIETCNKTFSQQDKIAVLDIGTGSGNIAISIAKNVQNAYILGIDINGEAVKTASENAQIHNVEDRVQFRVADIFDANFFLKLKNKIDIVVSNPPYVSQQEFDALPIEIKNFEPYIALDGGKDGLNFYHQMLKVSKEISKSNGIIGFEICYNKGELIKEIALKYGFKDVEIIKDLNEIDRVIIGRKTEN